MGRRAGRRFEPAAADGRPTDGGSRQPCLPGAGPNVSRPQRLCKLTSEPAGEEPRSRLAARRGGSETGPVITDHRAGTGMQTQVRSIGRYGDITTRDVTGHPRQSASHGPLPPLPLSDDAATAIR